MMEKIFEISMHVEEPIVVGQDASSWQTSIDTDSFRYSEE
jgi:hypothetical protein